MMNTQIPLFDFPDTGFCPPTEGIKYAGSKAKIIPHILQLADSVGARSVFDGFSGTTRVSQAFARFGYRVTANDTAPWSEVFAKCYLLSHKNPREYAPLIQHLNTLPPVDGWFTEHYGGYENHGSSIQSDGLKKPWQIHNTRKLDAIRQEIEDLKLSGCDKAVALTSLIVALDKVDNTLGHFVSYLKNWSNRSYNTLQLHIPMVSMSSGQHRVMRGDIFHIAPEANSDIAYLDPPYGSNNDKMPPSRVRYASYYHLWTSICLYDMPELVGRSKRRKDAADMVATSVFEEFRQGENGRYIAVDAVDRLLHSIQSRWVILSYSSGGRATAEELHEVIRKNGRLVKTVSIGHQKHVMASMKWTSEWLNGTNMDNKEFLFLIEK